MGVDDNLVLNDAVPYAAWTGLHSACVRRCTFRVIAGKIVVSTTPTARFRGFCDDLRSGEPGKRRAASGSISHFTKMTTRRLEDGEMAPDKASRIDGCDVTMAKFLSFDKIPTWFFSRSRSAASCRQTHNNSQSCNTSSGLVCF